MIPKTELKALDHYIFWKLPNTTTTTHQFEHRIFDLLCLWSISWRENGDGLLDFVPGDLLPKILHMGHLFGETNAFGGGNPRELEAFWADALLLHLLADLLYAALGPVVGVDVVAVAGMAAGNQYAQDDGKCVYRRG